MKRQAAATFDWSAGIESVMDHPGPPRILVVEDEAATADVLRQALQEAGCSVRVAQDGIVGKECWLSGRYDLVVLDYMLPGLSGMQILELARTAGMQTPVIMLTARSAVSDRVKGLDTGADDYLVKPFSLEELMARVRVALRHAEARRTLTCGDVEFDLDSRRVVRGGTEIFMSPTEQKLLELLMRKKDSVVDKATILREVWADSDARMTNVVEVYINYLRSKLDRLGRRCILNVRGVGYMMSSRGDAP